MGKAGIHIMALQETRATSTTQYVMDGFLFILYGGGGKQEYAGVGFIVGIRVRRAIAFATNAGSRIAVLGASAGPRKIILISAYAPHNARPVQEKAAFYEDLSNVYSSFETKGAVVTLGDMNARITEITIPG
eukprot:2305499-Alexandrium_andersonii.AAC.1